MPASVLGSDDLEWAVQVLRRRREPLVAFAPVFWRPAGRRLWNAFARETHGAEVRFVCPHVRARPRAVRPDGGLAVGESWWLLEVPGTSGAAAGVHVDLAGSPAVTVAAPPVYDPGGSVLFLQSVNNASATIPAAVGTASELGCPAVVVRHVAGHDALAQALSGAGFRQHCDYYTGAVHPV